MSPGDEGTAGTRGRFVEPAGPFCLGIIPTLAPYILPWFLAEFSERYPAVEIRDSLKGLHRGPHR